VLSYGIECSCQWLVTGLSYAVCYQFKGNLGIVVEGIVVGVFVVIAVNTMMMALFGVIVSALADSEVSAFMHVVLTQVCWLRW
jgi:hypothetical protein